MNFKKSVLVSGLMAQGLMATAVVSPTYGGVSSDTFKSFLSAYSTEKCDKVSAGSESKYEDVIYHTISQDLEHRTMRLKVFEDPSIGALEMRLSTNGMQEKITQMKSYINKVPYTLHEKVVSSDSPSVNADVLTNLLTHYYTNYRWGTGYGDMHFISKVSNAQLTHLEIHIPYNATSKSTYGCLSPEITLTASAKLEFKMDIEGNHKYPSAADLKDPKKKIGVTDTATFGIEDGSCFGVDASRPDCVLQVR